jgi:hypothetical protein
LIYKINRPEKNLPKLREILEMKLLARKRKHKRDAIIYGAATPSPLRASSELELVLAKSN